MNVVDWEGVIGFEGIATGDGRFITEGALAWTTPVPLRYAPEQKDGHDGAVVVGVIDEIVREGQNLVARGRIDVDGPVAKELELLGSLGVSMDLGAITVQDPGDYDDLIITSGRIRAATLVAIPAFEGASIRLVSKDSVVASGSFQIPCGCDAAGGNDVEDDDRKDDDTLASTGGPLSDDEILDALESYDPEGDRQLESGVGRSEWFHEAVGQVEAEGMDREEAERVIAQAARRWCAGEGSVNADTSQEACDLLDDMGIDEGDPNADLAALVASAVAPIKQRPAEWFADPKLAGPTRLTVTEDGRVYGHLALWKTCHTGYNGACVTPPRSKTNYSYFHVGTVDTTGGPQAVGKITLGTVHAAGNLSAPKTQLHYEHTGAQAAYVRAGEDEHGIWIAGAVRSGLAGDQLEELRASSLSGDWREIAGNLELVGALSVNVAGFPVPEGYLAASGHQLSLVASGIVKQDVPVEAHRSFHAKPNTGETLAQIELAASRIRLARVASLIRGYNNSKGA